MWIIRVDEKDPSLFELAPSRVIHSKQSTSDSKDLVKFGEAHFNQSLQVSGDRSRNQESRASRGCKQNKKKYLNFTKSFFSLQWSTAFDSLKKKICQVRLPNKAVAT